MLKLSDKFFTNIAKPGFLIGNLNRRQTFIMPYYAVAKGRNVGIFSTWAECESQVKGFSGARYKKFNSEQEAQNFIRPEGSSSYSQAKQKPTIDSNNKNQDTFTTKRRFYSTASKGINQKSTDSSQSDSDDSDELSEIISKQLDDIEKRLVSVEKGNDKILKRNAKNSGRQAILIEPPEKKSRSNSGFELDEDGFVQVFTDGACSSNGQTGARAGLGVYWAEDHRLNVSRPVSGRATNNCGEIQAATCAIQQALEHGITKLAINTDSQFLINSVTKWIPGWKKKGWKLSTGEPVKNEVDFKELDKVQNKLQIKWNYVKAHKGVHGNEMADRLAKEGAAMYNK